MQYLAYDRVGLAAYHIAHEAKLTAGRLRLAQVWDSPQAGVAMCAFYLRLEVAASVLAALHDNR
jgi:hypothetical protein